MNRFPVRLFHLSVAAPVAVAFMLSTSAALASSGGPGNGTGGKDAGTTPSGQSQSAGWTPAQSQTYALKLQGLSAVSSRSGVASPNAFAPAGLPRAAVRLCPSIAGSATCGPPVAKTISIYNDPEPNSYYGYQCGPAAGHNALGAYGVNVPIGSGYYPNASGLTQEMHTTSNGTDRASMPGPLNSHQSRNTYAWQTLGNPPGTTNGSGVTDLMYYTVTDIWYNDAPIYNIETYGYDPIQKKWRYPFAQYSGVDIRHYVAAYGYSGNGAWISISDSAVKYSHSASQTYTQSAQDVWTVIHNHPALDAILW